MVRSFTLAAFIALSAISVSWSFQHTLVGRSSISTISFPGSALFSSKKEETTPFSITSPRDRVLSNSKQVVGMLAAAVSAAVLGEAAVEAENGGNGNGDNGNRGSSSVVVLGAGGQTGKLVVRRLACPPCAP